MIDLWRGERYRLYTIRNGQVCGIAEASDAEAIGLALITIAEEHRAAGGTLEPVGVLDWHAHRWLTNPGWVVKAQTPFH